jgi:hypothetical protein
MRPFCECRPRIAERGFTIVEVVVAVALSVLVCLAAAATVSVSRSGHERSISAARTTGHMRDASLRMREDVCQSSNAGRFFVSVGPDGNDVIRMQQPITLPGGGSSWGAVDPSLPLDQRMRDGHWTRYEVVAAAGDRVLVRRVVDGLGAIVSELVVARGIASGAANPRGLRVETVGATRRITIGFNTTSNQTTPSLRFDVVLRN